MKVIFYVDSVTLLPDAKQLFDYNHSRSVIDTPSGDCQLVYTQYLDYQTGLITSCI